MTIDPASCALLRGLVRAVPMLVIAWLALLALVMRLGGETPAALALFPPSDLLANLVRDVQVTSVSAVSMTLRSDAPDLVARLYAGGVWLVLPVELERCLSGRRSPSFR